MVLLDSAGDTWVHANQAWTKIESPVSPPAREHAAMTFDYQTRRVLLVGGRAADRTALTDVWELTGDTWRPVYVPGPGPLPRAEHGLASHRFGRVTVLLGGSSDDGYAWLFKYRSATPDEICDGNADDDEDLHLDNDDPDCTER